MAALRSGHVALQLTLKLTRVASLSRDITGIDFAVQRGASAGLTVKYGPVDQPLWDPRREAWCGHEQRFRAPGAPRSQHEPAGQLRSP